MSALRRTLRAAWPLAVLGPVLVARHLPVFADDGYTTFQSAGLVTAIALGIAWAGLATGGRDGLLLVVVLVAAAVYCAWWFSLGIDQNITPYSWSLATEGLVRWERYLAGLATNLWPILLAAAAAVVLAGRRLGVPAWRAVALLTTTLLVLATPYRAWWSDGCNDHDGAAPAILASVASPLMDAGVGVIPVYGSTLIDCVRRGPSQAYGEESWKPFWKVP